jgi:putative transposase
MALSFDRATESLLRHVVARARGRRVLFADASARAMAVRRLAAICARHRLQCLVFSVTDRCLHVVMRGPAAAGALASEELAGASLRPGHCLTTILNADLYLLEVARHALLSPVRAGLVRRAIDWPHSSARESVGLQPAPAWLDPTPLFDLLGPRDGRGAERFRRYLEDRATFDY